MCCDLLLLSLIVPPGTELHENEFKNRCSSSKGTNSHHHETGEHFVLHSTSNMCMLVVMVAHLLPQVTKSMAGVVKGMDSALKSMNLEKVQTFTQLIMVNVMFDNCVLVWNEARETFAVF